MNSHAQSGQQSVCLSKDDLRAFHSGTMPLDAMETAADHLGVCPGCTSVLTALSNEDTVVSKLRQYLPTAPPAGDPECERLAAAARKIHLEQTAAIAPMSETLSQAQTAARASRTEATAPPRHFGNYELLEKLG
jgi:hypothetical protein